MRWRTVHLNLGPEWRKPPVIFEEESMDPFKDVTVILNWARGQGASWYEALSALLDLIQFVLKQIPAPSAGMRAAPAMGMTGLPLTALADKLEGFATEYKTSPQTVNWGAVLSLLLTILKYIGG